MDNLKMKELYTRNYPFINHETQEKLSKLKIALVGVGLSSQVAHAMVRVGVRNFKVWDKDAVSQSNLNRQAFKQNDLGKNKAFVTTEHILDIDDGIKVEAYGRHFETKDLQTSLDDVDVVVNSADFETSLVYELNDYMQQLRKWCIQPLNLGFGGACLVFGDNSPSLESMTKGKQENPVMFIKNLLDKAEGFKPSKQLEEQGDALLMEGAKAGWFPQNVIATLISTSLITWAIVKIAEGDGEQILAPKILHFEPDF